MKINVINNKGREITSLWLFMFVAIIIITIVNKYIWWWLGLILSISWVISTIYTIFFLKPSQSGAKK